MAGLPAGAGAGTTSGRASDTRGPGGVTVAAPLDRLPLLVRGGAILPLGPVVQHTRRAPARRDHAADLSPEPARSRFELYEDDGRSNAYRQGRHALTADRVRDRARAGHGADRRAHRRPLGGARRVAATGFELASGRAAERGDRGRPRRAAAARAPDASGPGWWVDARSVHHASASPTGPAAMVVSAQLLKYQVSVWAM